MASTTEFQAAFKALRDILKKHSDGMIIHADQPDDFTIITKAIGPNKKPLWFAAVYLKKSAVTYHLVPLYYNPALQADIPATLLPRKQGKTCFNFQRPDAELFTALDSLTGVARASWQRHGFLESGPIPQERFDAALEAAGINVKKLATERAAKGKSAAKKRKATISRKKKTKR